MDDTIHEITILSETRSQHMKSERDKLDTTRRLRSAPQFGVYIGGTSEIADPPKDTRFFLCCCCFHSMRPALVLVLASDDEGGGVGRGLSLGNSAWTSTGSVCPALNRIPESAWNVACRCSRSRWTFSDCLAMLDQPSPLSAPACSWLCEKELSEGVAGRQVIWGP